MLYRTLINDAHIKFYKSQPKIVFHVERNRCHDNTYVVQCTNAHRTSILFLNVFSGCYIPTFLTPPPPPRKFQEWFFTYVIFISIKVK